ncbi:MAG: hypothetical protein ACXABO_06720 [Promethearchaeota archaeon]|jgi:uncharacterized protein YwgA
MKNFGLPVDFSFNWYKHGPYSPKLADIYYQVKNFKKQQISITESLSEKEVQIIEEARPLIEKLKGNNEKLEFYASILFIIKDMIFFNSEKSDSTIEQKIKELKPEIYSHTSYLNSLNDLNSFNLI